MILSRLFHELFDRGLILVATANLHPDNLCNLQFHSQNYFPLISLLKKHCTVLFLGSGHDYRQPPPTHPPAQTLPPLVVSKPPTSAPQHIAFFSPLNASICAKMDFVFKELLENHDESPALIKTPHRSLVVRRQNSVQRVARFTFSELCGQSLGAAEYLVIASTYDILLLDSIPKLALYDDRNEIRRWIILMDTLYEHKVPLA